MCGRFSNSTSPREIARLTHAQLGEDVEEVWQPRWNIGPSRRILAVFERSEHRVVELYVWGLVPWFARDPSAGRRSINARAESVRTRPSFRAAFEKRRILVPADAYYEWKGDKGHKQPYAFGRADGQPLMLAGLREAWRDRTRPEGDPEAWLRTALIVTTEAGPDNAPIHDRQPAVLEPEDWEAWLTSPDLDEVERLLRPSAAGTLRCWPVSTAVSNVRNEGAGLLEEVDRTKRPSAST